MFSTLKTKLVRFANVKTPLIKYNKASKSTNTTHHTKKNEKDRKEVFLN